MRTYLSLLWLLNLKCLWLTAQTHYVRHPVNKVALSKYWVENNNSNLYLYCHFIQDFYIIVLTAWNNHKGEWNQGTHM